MTTRPAQPEAREPLPLAARVAIVLAAGLAVGAATSILQLHLHWPWLALVNSASPWVVPAFAVGAMKRRVQAAAAAGLAACLLEVAGYYATARLLGFQAGHLFVLFWTVCALAGGPLFGAAGWLWRAGPAKLRGLGAAALPAAFLAEGLAGYGLRLHYASSAVLFAVLGAAAAIMLGYPGRRSASLARWLVPVLAAGIIAELVLDLVYSSALARMTYLVTG